MNPSLVPLKEKKRKSDVKKMTCKFYLANFGNTCCLHKNHRKDFIWLQDRQALSNGARSRYLPRDGQGRRAGETATETCRRQILRVGKLR